MVINVGLVYLSIGFTHVSSMLAKQDSYAGTYRSLVSCWWDLKAMYMDRGQRWARTGCEWRWRSSKGVGLLFVFVFSFWLNPSNSVRFLWKQYHLAQRSQLSPVQRSRQNSAIKCVISYSAGTTWPSSLAWYRNLLHTFWRDRSREDFNDCRIFKKNNPHLSSCDPEPGLITASLGTPLKPDLLSVIWIQAWSRKTAETYCPLFDQLYFISSYFWIYKKL